MNLGLFKSSFDCVAKAGMSGAQAEFGPVLGQPELEFDELDEREEDLSEVEFEETSFDSNQFRRAALYGKKILTLAQNSFDVLRHYLSYATLRI